MGGETMGLLKEILQPHTEQDLLSHFSENRPLVLSPSRPQLISGLLDWRDIEDLLAMNRYDNPGLRLVRNGKEMSSDGFCFHQFNFRGEASPLVNRRKLLQRFREGCTIVYDDLEAKCESFATLSCDLERLFLDYCSCHLYVSGGTEPGLSAHWDDHDVLVFQIVGTKKWQLWAPGIEYPIREFQKDNRGSKGQHYCDIELTAGNMLVLPRGWWHDPRPCNNLSVHVSIAINRRTGLTYMGWLMRKAVERQFMRQNIEYGIDGRVSEDYSERIRDELIGLIRRHSTADYLSQFRSELQYRPKFAFPSDLADPQVDDLDGKYVRWALGSVQQVDEHDGVVTLRCIDCTLEFPSVSRDFVETLLSGEWHRTDDLYRTVSGVSTLEAFSQVLGDLSSQGIILVKGGEGTRA